MDFVKIDESIKAAQSALAQAVAHISEGDVAPDDVWMQVLGPVYVMRDQARPFLKEPESILDASNAVADWSKPNFDSAVAYGDRYVSQLRACRRYLEISQTERIAHPTVTSAEEIAALHEFNAAVRLAYGYAIIIKRFAEAEHVARTPLPPTGPGPFGSFPKELGAFAEAIQEINAKLDRILDQFRPEALTGAEAFALAGESELLVLVREIAAWVRSQQGTGESPVVAIEGVVGELVERYPWHSTAGVVGVYGGLGQPKGVLGLWQYDALFKMALTGTFIMVSTPLSDTYQVRKTVLGDGHFWVSIGSSTIPRQPVDVVISDVNAQGNRVVQRIQV